MKDLATVLGRVYKNVALRGVNNEENRGIEETIDAIFGEERAEACKRIIKACESDSAKAV